MLHRPCACVQGPQSAQLPGAPMMDLQALAPDPQQQQHLQQQQQAQQQYQMQLQALAQKAHEVAPAVPDGSAWEFDGALANLNLHNTTVASNKSPPTQEALCFVAIRYLLEGVKYAQQQQGAGGCGACY